MTERATPEEVLAWMAANRAGADRAAKQFNMPKSTVILWMRRARETPVSTRRTGPVHGGGNITILSPPPPPPKARIPKGMQARARRLIRKAFVRLDKVIDSADARECTTIITTLADRFDLFADLKVKGASTVADPTPGTPEGDAATMALLDQIPAHVLRAAMERKAG